MGEPHDSEMDQTIPPVIIPKDTPWYALLVLENWARIRRQLIAILALGAAAAPVLYEHADIIKANVSDLTFHRLGVAYMLFMWWNIIRNNRTSNKGKP